MKIWKVVIDHKYVDGEPQDSIRLVSADVKNETRNFFILTEGRNSDWGYYSRVEKEDWMRSPEAAVEHFIEFQRQKMTTLYRQYDDACGMLRTARQLYRECFNKEVSHG